MEYGGKTVLVTGGAGFIGSTLARQLLQQNAKVIVYDSMLIGDESNLSEVRDSIKIIKADIRDRNLGEVFRKNNVDFVFNLAAEPFIPHCYEGPREFFDVNAMGALNVMLASKEGGVKRMMQYSTSEVYGTAKQSPMDEHHVTNPMSTYAVSKLAADRLCFTLFHEQKLPIITLRQFNCYGPRESQPYVIPEIISQLSKSHKVRLGNIKATRDLTYVDDAAQASVLLMKYKEAEGQIFNCGYGKDFSIEEIAHIVGEHLGHKQIEIQIDPTRLRPLDVEKLQCNYFKLHQLTGWKPKVGLHDGLKRTIDHFNESGKVWLWEKKIIPEDRMWKSEHKTWQKTRYSKK